MLARKAMNCQHDMRDRAGSVAPPKPWVAQATSLSRPATGRTERGGAPISAANADLPVARPSRLRVQHHLCRNHRAQSMHGVQPKNTKTLEIALLSIGVGKCGRKYQPGWAVQRFGGAWQSRFCEGRATSCGAQKRPGRAAIYPANRLATGVGFCEKNFV